MSQKHLIHNLFQLTAIHLLVTLFLFTERKTAEANGDDNDFDIQYQHRLDDETSNFNENDDED